MLTNSLPFTIEALVKLTTFHDSQSFQVCLGIEKAEIEKKVFQWRKIIHSAATPGLFLVTFTL